MVLGHDRGRGHPEKSEQQVDVKGVSAPSRHVVKRGINRSVFLYYTTLSQNRLMVSQEKRIAPEKQAHSGRSSVVGRGCSNNDRFWDNFKSLLSPPFSTS